MTAEKKWVRGFFDQSKYGFRIKLHKDAIEKIKSGEWKPVGEFYQIEVGQKKNGTGYYLAEDNWAPDPNYKKQPTLPINSPTTNTPVVGTTGAWTSGDDSLPF